MSAVGAAATFVPRGRSSAALLFQRRPKQNPCYRFFADPGCGPSVFVNQRVLNQLLDAALGAFPNETIGVLLGRPCRDEQGTYSIVEASLTAGSQEHEGTGGAVRISADGRSMLHRRAAAAYPVLEPVGWWHSHPHGPPWYSSVDLDEQATYPKPYHVGIVVAVRDHSGRRGDQGRFGVYAGPEGVRLSLAPVEEFASVPDDASTGTPGPRPAVGSGGGAAIGEWHPAVPAALTLAVLLLVLAALWTGLGTEGGSNTTGGAEVRPRARQAPSLQVPLWPEWGRRR